MDDRALHTVDTTSTEGTVNRLSHSSVTKFQDCPQAWKFHYRERLRVVAQSGALLFGSAVDAALTALVKGATPEDVIATFERAWSFQEVNGTMTALPRSVNVVYAESDFDQDLLTDEDRQVLIDTYKLDDLGAALKTVYDEKDYFGFVHLPDDRKEFLNHANWLSLYRKGLLMIEACRRDVLPNIEEVLSVQKYVELANTDGDRIIGFADIVVRWKGIERPVVLDWKTSARDYEKGAVLVSPQLTLYVHALYEEYQTRWAGFIVFKKRMEKTTTKVCSKCGQDGTGKKHRTCDIEYDGERCKGEWSATYAFKANTQILIDEIPEQTESIVLENMDYINQAIKNGIFHRNFNSCIKAWGKCPFYNKCYRADDSGLVQLDGPTDEKIPSAPTRG